MNKKLCVLGAMFFLIIILAGCMSEKMKWNNAKVKNTITAYENYLKNYPEGVYIDSAKIYLEGLYFQEALAADTIPAYANFINKYPQSVLADSMRSLLEKFYIYQISGKLIQDNALPSKGQDVYLLYVNQDTVSLKFENNKPINPAARCDAHGNFVIKFVSKNYSDLKNATIGINSSGLKIIKLDNKPIMITIDEPSKKIELGSIVFDLPQIMIDKEIIWNVDSTGTYYVEGVQIKGASRITLNKDFSFNLDKGNLLDNIDLDKASEH